MIVSELKPFEEILNYLTGENKIFLVGCKGCAEASHTGGEPQVLEMKEKLEKGGQNYYRLFRCRFPLRQSLNKNETDAS